ncbi:MAG: YihY/virulence factor BrkB family protein [Actinomycetota bacterium]|nr:YihY/virulence factor BrkB family protein [Actinomycetota bacterium]
MRELIEPEAIVRRAPVWARPAVELVVRTVRDTFDDRVPGLAAEVAFYFVLSVPPMLLILLGSVGYVGELVGAGVAEQLRDELLGVAGVLLATETVDRIVAPTLGTLLREGRGEVASLGIVALLWSSSRAVNVLLTTLVIAYDLEESGRTGWRQRLMSLGLTVLVLVASVVLIPLLVVGPRLGADILGPLGVVSELLAVWRLAYWPVAGLLCTLLLATLYHHGTPWWTPWRRDLPGAVLAMAVWLAGSVALRVWGTAMIRSEAAYAPFSAPLVVLLWLYLLGFAVLLGAELNAEIEKMWPLREERETLMRRVRRGGAGSA